MQNNCVNSRLDSLNAEVLSFRLKKLRNIINRRKNINYYKIYKNRQGQNFKR